MTHAAGAATAAVPGGDDRVGAALTPAIHAGDTPPEATRALDGRGDAPVPRAKSPGVQRWSKFPASLRDELPRPPSPGHETRDAIPLQLERRRRRPPESPQSRLRRPRPRVDRRRLRRRTGPGPSGPALLHLTGDPH